VGENVHENHDLLRAWCAQGERKNSLHGRQKEREILSLNGPEGASFTGVRRDPVLSPAGKPDARK